MADTHKGSQVPCTSHKRSGTINPSQRGQEVGNDPKSTFLFGFIFAEILPQIGVGGVNNGLLARNKELNSAVKRIEKSYSVE